MPERLAREVVIPAEAAGERLDTYLARHFSEAVSRSQIQKLIGRGAVRVAGREANAHYRIKAGERVAIQWPERRAEDTRAEDIPVEILFEDDDLLLLNKPAGMVVHPAQGNREHTLVNALLFHTGRLSRAGGAARPGIVHRLDKDTSGIMIVAKNDAAHAALARQFKDHTMERVYRVIVRGVVQHDEGVCEEAVGRAFVNRKKVVVKPSGGKEAVTFYRVLRRYAKGTLLEVRPHTGRTHQIRVHMRHLGHPVLGDALYGVATPAIGRQAVHAFGLGFAHPRTGKRVYHECPLPPDMEALLKALAEDRV